MVKTLGNYVSYCQDIFLEMEMLDCCGQVSYHTSVGSPFSMLCCSLFWPTLLGTYKVESNAVNVETSYHLLESTDITRG